MMVCVGKARDGHAQFEPNANGWIDRWRREHPLLASAGELPSAEDELSGELWLALRSYVNCSRMMAPFDMLLSCGLLVVNEKARALLGMQISALLDLVRYSDMFADRCFPNRNFQADCALAYQGLSQLRVGGCPSLCNFETFVWRESRRADFSELLALLQNPASNLAAWLVKQHSRFPQCVVQSASDEIIKRVYVLLCCSDGRLGVHCPMLRYQIFRFRGRNNYRLDPHFDPVLLGGHGPSYQ